MSSANLVALRRVAEVTLGTTPASPALANTRFTRESLNFNISMIESREIRVDRNLSDVIPAGAEGNGDIEFELSYDSFNDLIESALASTWSAGPDIFNLTNGATRKGFTIQKHFTDITQFLNYKGCVVNRMALNMAIGQPVTGRFNIMCMDVDRVAAQLGGATTPAVNTNPIFNVATNIGSLLIDSVPYTGCINSLSFETNNNLRGTSCIGTLGFKDILLGAFDVTGAAEIYFADGTLYDKFLADQTFGVKVNLMDSLGNQFDVEVPKASIQTAEVVAGGRDTDVMIALTWRAIYDTGISGSIKIVRNNVG